MANDKSNGEGPDSETDREALLDGVLRLSGARDYQRITAEEVVAMAGTDLVRFNELFLDLEDCYATAYERWAQTFGDQLLRDCGREIGWPARIRTAMQWLVRYSETQPTVARGAIAQAPAAGKRVQVARRNLLERLSHAVDAARRETDLSRHSPPPATAPFIVGGIAWSVESALREREGPSVAERAPDLVFFAVTPYFGEETAWAERAAMEDFV